MANQYHNLGGWLRDVKNVLGDEGYPLADSYYWELRQLIEQVLAELDGDDVTDAEDLEPSDGDDDVADAGTGDGGDTGEERRRARAGSTSDMGRPSRVGRNVPRESDAPVERRVRSHAAAVAGAPCGVGHRQPPVVSDGMVPVGNRAKPQTRASSSSSSRAKGGARGTRKTSRRSKK